MSTFRLGAVAAASLVALAAGSCARAVQVTSESGTGMSAASVGVGASSQVPQRGGALLYVANQNAASISIIDMSTNSVVRTVDLQALGFGEDAKPHHIAVEPDGSYWYVSLIGANRILKMDPGGHIAAQAEFERPGMMVLDPRGGMLYVGRSMTAVNPPHSVGVVRRSDMSLDEVGVVYPRPHAIALTPDGALVYSASLAENRMGVIRTSDQHVDLAEIPGPLHTLVQWAISPDGGTLVGTGEMSGDLVVYSLEDPAHPRYVKSLHVGSRPWHPVFTPDGRRVYFGLKGDDAVAVIDVATWSIEKKITGAGIAEPHGSAVSPDGRWVYISNNNLKGTYVAAGGAEPTGTVVVIDAHTNDIAKVIPVGANAAGIGATPPR